MCGIEINRNLCMDVETAGVSATCSPVAACTASTPVLAADVTTSKLAAAPDPFVHMTGWPEMRSPPAGSCHMGLPVAASRPVRPPSEAANTVSLVTTGPNAAVQNDFGHGSSVDQRIYGRNALSAKKKPEREIRTRETI